MKKSQSILILFVLSFLFSSCLKKVLDVTPDGDATMTIDGKKTTLKTPTSVSLMGVVTITAGDTKNGYTIILNKADIKAGKQYDLKNAVGFFTILYEGDAYIPSTGTLEITDFKDNKIVEGKFTLDGNRVTKKEDVSFSGNFSVKIIL